MNRRIILNIYMDISATRIIDDFVDIFFHVDQISSKNSDDFLFQRMLEAYLIESDLLTIGNRGLPVN